MREWKEKDVYIHLASPDEINLKQIHVLDAIEYKRAQAFKFAKDQTLYIAAHIFLRQTLSRYATLSPEKWCFKHNYYGKPSIDNDGYRHLHFNLSHTQGLIACAVSYRYIVGIDVEQYRQLDDLNTLASYALARKEVEDLCSIADKQQQIQRFFTYWTLKEAYIKARGMGLSIPLQQFTFTKKNKQWQIYCAPQLRDNGKNWHFSTHSLGDHHLSLGVWLSID